MLCVGSVDSWVLIWPVLGVGFAATIHVAIARYARRRSEWGHLLMGIAAGIVYVWGGTIASSSIRLGLSQLVAALLLNTVSYLSTAYIYADFNNLNFTSVRIRVLRECGRAEQGVTDDQLSLHYDAKSLVVHRLDEYTSKGFLIKEADSYRIGKPTLVWIFRMYQLMYRVLFGAPMPVVPTSDKATHTHRA